MEKTIGTFKKFSEKGYKHYIENTIEKLDELSLDSSDIITEFAHLCEWLRINHGIWISITYIDDILNFGYTITTIKDNCNQKEEYNFKSPQEAYSAAFNYILNNLT
jgi:hypothetical protein